MRKRLISVLALLALALIVRQPAAAIPPRAADYYAQPPLMVGSTKPAILMILSKDMDIYAPAYVNPADHDGDGRIDVGFNPGVVYTGIFDPYSCYTYNVVSSGKNSGSTPDKHKDWGLYPNWIDRPHFVRLGPSIEDKEDSIGPYKDANRLPKEIRDGYDDSFNGRPGFPAPRSATGICPAKNKVDGTQDLDQYGKQMTAAKPESYSTFSETRIWSGNWLNWLTSSRLDVIRQVLYGGKRVVDTPDKTFIAAEWIPNNAGVWSYDDFTKYFWLDYNEGADYYDSTNYTPVDPDRFAGRYRRLHSYGRTDNRFFIYDNVWFMRQKEDVTSHEGFRSYNAYLVPKFRNQYTPLVYVLNSFASREKTEFWEVTVEACRQLTREEVYDFTGRLDYAAGKSGQKRPANKSAIPTEALIEAGDYCERYGDKFKPVGLLQRYAKMDQALFGLMTGAFNNINRWDGGWLRHNVKSIKGQINADGTYKGTSQNNIFLMLDSINQVAKPRLAPLNEARTAVDATAKSQGSGWQDPLESNFGNPIGEMLYAGLLYFAHESDSPYSMYPSPSLMGPEEIRLPRLGAGGGEDWQSPLFANAVDCLKPVILLLSSTTASHDGDMIPGSPHGEREGAGQVPVLSLPFPEPERTHNYPLAGIPRIFSMAGYLDAITRLEGLAGKSFYIANLNTGAPGAKTVGNASRQPADPGDTNLCVPRILTSLADVRGLCPSAPQTYGTYSAAAAAYYGNTHDFDGSGSKVQTFAVALPSIFPKINLESRGRVISISPVAMSVAKPCGDDSGKAPFCENGRAPYGIQHVGPFTTNVIQWRADDQGRVYSGAVFAGFTGRLEGEGDDYQLDAPVRYYFDLIRECRPGECDRGNVESFRYQTHPGHSGYPSYDDERDVAYVFFHQPYDEGHPITDKSKPGVKKYREYNDDVYNTDINNRQSSTGRCNNATRREMVAGCGSKKEKEVAVKILKGWYLDGNRDGRYAGAPFKRHREWVYQSWDHAGRPNYIFSGERPKNYNIATYMPKRWSQLPGYFHRPTGILSADTDPDPTLMQAYARLVYPDFGNVLGTGGKAGREAVMRTLPGAEGFVDSTSNNIISKPYKDPALGRYRSGIDYVYDETSSLFIDRPFTDLGYEEVMDVYGYIGDPYKIYKKVTNPNEIDQAVGVAVFVYSLNEKMDLSDRNMPMNIGYHLHGGVNYAQSQRDNPSRALGDAQGTYLEIQNEHNYMGGSPQRVLNEGLSVKVNNDGREFGLMTIAHPLNTPPTCYRAGTMDFAPMNFRQAESSPILFKNGVTGNAQMPGYASDTAKVPHKLTTPGCGSARLPLTATRFFRFPVGAPAAPPSYLPDPLWLAAKYGGFNDDNYDGIPQKTEYDVLPSPNGDGIPDNYFYANTLSELKEKLSEAFERIMSAMSVGTATSASVNSVLGGGVTVRTYFQTVHSPSKAPETPEIKWLGGTYALFIDLWGNMREDTNGNGKLDLDCGFKDDPGSSRDDGANAKGDWIVEFVDCNRLSSAAEILACGRVRDDSDIKTVARVYPDQNGKNYLDKGSKRVKYLSLDKIKTVWNLSRNLSALKTRQDVVSPRASYANLNSPKRRVYFYHESLMAGSNLQFGQSNLFEPSKAASLAPYMLQDGSNSAAALIEYVLGWDQAGYRSRKTLSPWHDLSPGSEITCRLGDVINSQPIISGAPFSSYDYLYGDASYGAYRNRYAKRRHLALVGANDGMLHAVNMGFPISLKDGYNGYTDERLDFIGREMWAFIPQSVLPHLQWLAQMDYAHSYYLDLTPTVVELKDPSKGEAQGGPWRTVIIGSLRFGGRAIEMSAKPPKYSYSEVFALDVTEPDKEPVLLWRFSHPQMGLIVARPTVVRNNQSGDGWKVLVASGPTYDSFNPLTGQTETTKEGPTAYKGYSNQSAKIFVFDAVSGPSGGVTVLDTDRPKSFFTSMQALTAPGATVKKEADGSISWNNNLAYFSLTQSALDNDLLCLANSSQTGAYLDAGNPKHYCSASKYSNYGYLDKGGVWRLDMRGPVSSWRSGLKVFYDSDRPISAAVNTTYDQAGRLWVIFGSGRFWTNDDAHLCEGAAETKECRVNHVNYLYGIKEPWDPDTRELTYAAASESGLMDVSNILVYPGGEVGELDRAGTLQPVPNGLEPISDYASLYNRILSDSVGGYRRALKTNSVNFIDSDEVDSPAADQYKDGENWWSGLSFEMILEQAALAPFGGGSIMSLSTFLPRSLVCGSNGHSYGLLLDTFTGLPKPVFGSQGFLEINSFQNSRLPTNSAGDAPVSDHVDSVKGKSAAAVFVVTGTNEGKHGQFEIVNSDGTVTVFKLPDNDTVKGGVISWREVLDFGGAGQ